MSVAPTAKLPGWGLLGLLVMIAVVGLSVYATFPDAVGGPPLPVDAEPTLAVVPTVGSTESDDPTAGGNVSAKVIRVVNRSDGPIKHLNVILNGHYMIVRDSPLQPSETLDLPQAIFTDKRSSRRFDPRRQTVDKIVVRGQLPSGVRGVSVYHFGDAAAH